MEIEIKKEEGKLIVAPKDRIDSVTSGDLDEAIKTNLSNEINILYIDMKEVQYISSKAIRIFLTYHRTMEPIGKMVLANISNSVREVLKLSALINVFNIE